MNLFFFCYCTDWSGPQTVTSYVALLLFFLFVFSIEMIIVLFCMYLFFVLGTYRKISIPARPCLFILWWCILLFFDVQPLNCLLTSLFPPANFPLPWACPTFVGTCSIRNPHALFQSALYIFMYILSVSFAYPFLWWCHQHFSGSSKLQRTQ